MKQKVFLRNLYLFLLLLIVLSLILLKRENSSFDIRKKAQEETFQIPTTHWEPIRLAFLKENIESKYKEVEREISQTSPTFKKEIAFLKNYLEILKIEKEEYSLMDKNKDGSIDYQEFNARVLNLYEKTYPLKHRRVEKEKDGLYDFHWKAFSEKSTKIVPGSPKEKIILAIVEAGIYQDISTSLNIYRGDLKKDGYKLEIFLCNNCDKESIKNLLNFYKRRELNGAIFVGDLPVAWYKIFNCWGYSEVFPIDLYFMDLDGIWGEEINCNQNISCFTSHKGNVGPEIFLGRLVSPNEKEEIELINNYFRKNHQFREIPKEKEKMSLPNRSLNFIDDPWQFWAEEWSFYISSVYPNFDLIMQPEQTNACEFRNLWQKQYEHLFVAAHSNPYAHYFITTDNPFCWRVSSFEVKSYHPQFNFYNLFACSNALFSVEDYMAGWYVFQKSNYGLLAIGSTKTGAMLNFDSFYTPLRENKTFGEALKEWLNLFAPYKCWFGGMTIIGDPTLKPTL